MSFKNSPLFHFIIGTLWGVTAAITAYETQTYLGSVYWPPILFAWQESVFTLGVFI